MYKRQVSEASFSGEVIAKLVQQTGSSEEEITEFLSRIRTTIVISPNPEKLSRFFKAFKLIKAGQPVVVDRGDSSGDLVVAVRSPSERSTFQRTSESLSALSLDIEQAELIVVRFDKAADEPEDKRSDKVVLMNFVVSGSNVGPFEVEAWADGLVAGLAE